MKSISGVFNKSKEEKDTRDFFSRIKDIPPDPVTSIDIIPDYDYPIAMCSYSSLKYIPNEKLMNTLYCYNSSICRIPNSDLYRLFYRTGNEPKGYQDKIATCILDSNFEVDVSTNKYINVYSNWKETMTSKENIQLLNYYMFKDGEHVEDPRVVVFNNAFFVVYTDGIRIGVAKLDIDTCKTIYSHYIPVPSSVLHGESDGREKNWIPFVAGDKLYILYSDVPRTVFECEDTQIKLKVSGIFRSKSANWNYGFIRGGTPPCEYDENHLIWFFHSQTNYTSHVGTRRTYMIGAYVSKNTYPFDIVKISQLPLLIGIPAPASRTLSLAHCVVFPCGAIKTEPGWKISMGVHDYNTGFLDVTEEHFLWKNI